MNINELKIKIEKFLESKEPTMGMANEIELALDDYLGNDFLEETREALAMFRPEGGAFMFDTTTIKKRLQRVLEELNR